MDEMQTRNHVLSERLELLSRSYGNASSASTAISSGAASGLTSGSTSGATSVSGQSLLNELEMSGSLGAESSNFLQLASLRR